MSFQGWAVRWRMTGTDSNEPFVPWQISPQDLCYLQLKASNKQNAECDVSQTSLKVIKVQRNAEFKLATLAKQYCNLLHYYRII